MKYEEYVVLGILAGNKYNISVVNNLKSLKYKAFVKEEYYKIEDLIKSNKRKEIKAYPEERPQTGEYLDILSFDDQYNNSYIISIYDSDFLEQDPQVIEIYPVKKEKEI